MTSRLIVLVLAATAALGCKKNQATPDEAGAGPVASAAPSASAAPVARKPGQMPFADYTSGATTAKAGDYVLVPSGNWIDDAFVKGGEKQTFIYYAATMMEPGPLDSKVKSLAGTTFTAPNGFILPIKPAQKAKVGDILVTWWQSGSGMQRSIVTGGTPDAPTVLHLDMDLDNPAKIAQKEDTLKPNSFHKLGTGFDPGVTLACKDGTKLAKWIATGTSGDKVLAIGFAGSMKVFPKGNCTPIAPGQWQAGKDVAVPYIGSFQKAKVDKYDVKGGRVFAKFNWGGKDQNVGVGVQDAAPLLPGM